MLTTGFQPCLQFCKFRAAYPNLIGTMNIEYNVSVIRVGRGRVESFISRKREGGN